MLIPFLCRAHGRGRVDARPRSGDTGEALVHAESAAQRATTVAPVGQWSAKIGGGTDEIQRNTIGEKVLALPPEPRVDKNIPFRDIPR